MNEPQLPPDEANRDGEHGEDPSNSPTPHRDSDVGGSADSADLDEIADVDDIQGLADAEDLADPIGGDGDDDGSVGDDGDDDDGDDDDGDDDDGDDDDGDDDGDDDDGDYVGDYVGVGRGGGDGEEHRAVFVSTALPVPLRVAPLDDERAPGGSALGAFIGERLVARCAMPREAIEHLMELDLFAEPVALALLAVEEDPGLQCRLFALVPADRIMDDDEETPSEPWRSSVPSFEDALATMDGDGDDDPEDGDDDEESSAVASILLGHIVRFDRDRKFADDLTAEAADVLQRIVLGGELEDANSRAVDDLLDSL